MMQWMEKIADWSMIFDFPTGGISPGNMKPHADRLIAEGHDLKAMSVANGQSVDFNACLVQTKINNDLFLAERQPGATKFLNVLQGRNEAESKIWFDEVKGYPFEGWALAGGHQSSFSLILARLLDMLDEGILQNLRWLHVLGIATLEVGCLLTVLQRAVRTYINSDLQISFDSASPFISAGKNQMIVGHTVDERDWSTHSANVAEGSAIDLTKTVAEFCAAQMEELDEEPHRRRRFCSSVLDKMLTMSDICAGSSGTSDIDADASNLLMHHNVEAMVNAHADAQRTFFGNDPLPIPLRTKAIGAMINLIFEEYSVPTCRGGPYPKVIQWRAHLDQLAM
jgi:hypothetical protein